MVDGDGSDDQRDSGGPLSQSRRSISQHGGKGTVAARRQQHGSALPGLSALLGTSEAPAVTGGNKERLTIPGLRVLCGELLLKESCASCGGVGVRKGGKSLDMPGVTTSGEELDQCPSCSGSGLQATSCAHTLRRLSSGRSQSEQGQIAALACAFAAAA